MKLDKIVSTQPRFCRRNMNRWIVMDSMDSSGQFWIVMDSYGQLWMIGIQWNWIPLVHLDTLFTVAELVRRFLVVQQRRLQHWHRFVEIRKRTKRDAWRTFRNICSSRRRRRLLLEGFQGRRKNHDLHRSFMAFLHLSTGGGEAGPLVLSTGMGHNMAYIYIS